MKAWMAAPLFVLPLALSASGGEWFEGSLDTALAKAKTEQKTVLLKFYHDT